MQLNGLELSQQHEYNLCFKILDILPRFSINIIILPDTCTIASRVIIAKDRQVLTLTNSNLSKERHQVVGNTSRVFTQNTGGMSTGRVKVTEKSGIPALFSGTEIANNMFNKELSTAIGALGIL